MSSPLPVLVLVVVAVAAGLAVDGVVLDDEPRAGPPAVAVSSPESGAWWCAAGDTTGDNTLRAVATVPAAAARTSSVRIDGFEEGEVKRGAETEVFPGGTHERAVGAGAEQVGLAARWWRTPAAVTRLWRLATPGAPGGLVEGPCEPSSSQRWVVPGVSTAGGAQSTLVLANPFASDASVTVRLALPTGLDEPTLLENVVVPSRTVRRVSINEHAPEEPDVGVLVDVRSGRVVAEAVQTLDAAIGGIEGVSLVKAVPRPAETWTVPWFAAPPADREGEDASAEPSADVSAQSWLWVTNPDERPAALSLTLHTADGGVVPEGVNELTVGAGSVRRIDLRGLLPPGTTTGGITVRSNNGVPVAVSTATLEEDPTVARTGVAVQRGAPETADGWVLSGAGASGRTQRLHLVNVSSEAAAADVRLRTSLGALSPPELQGVGVPPGAAVTLDLTPHLPEGDGDLSAFVELSEGRLVVGREARNRESALDLVATLGVPSTVWQPADVSPRLERAAGLPQRVDTDLGPSGPRGPGERSAGTRSDEEAG